MGEWKESDQWRTLVVTYDCQRKYSRSSMLTRLAQSTEVRIAHGIRKLAWIIMTTRIHHADEALPCWDAPSRNEQGLDLIRNLVLLWLHWTNLSFPIPGSTSLKWLAPKARSSAFSRQASPKLWKTTKARPPAEHQHLLIINTQPRLPPLLCNSTSLSYFVYLLYCNSSTSYQTTMTTQITPSKAVRNSLRHVLWFFGLYIMLTLHRPRLLLTTSRWTNPLSKRSISPKAKRTRLLILLGTRRYQNRLFSKASTPQVPSRSSQLKRLQLPPHSTQRKQMSHCYRRTLTASCSSPSSTMR